MPGQGTWDGFFDPVVCLQKLGLSPDCELVIDFGCGYGTFSLASAAMIEGRVIALDLEQEMLDVTARQARERGLENVEYRLRDFVHEGSGEPDGSADYAMLFNILHADEPVTLLSEAKRVVRAGGIVAVMHWNHDENTPRGPDLSIRPTPEQCIAWAREAGLSWVDKCIHDLPPWHYGLVFTA